MKRADEGGPGGEGRRAGGRRVEKVGDLDVDKEKDRELYTCSIEFPLFV